MIHSMYKFENIFINILCSALFAILWKHIQDNTNIQHYIVAPCLVAFILLIVIGEKKNVLKGRY